MKIFSLETKKHLVGWSVSFALILFVGSNYFMQSIFGCHEPVNLRYAPFCPGRPIAIDLSRNSFGVNQLLVLITDFIFWFLVVLIILSLIRHFRYKK